jgi:hypothetical protein
MKIIWKIIIFNNVNKLISEPCKYLLNQNVLNNYDQFNKIKIWK